MIIYNVTVKIDNQIHDEWLEWMKTVHIPNVMETGLFLENKMCKILVEDPDGTNYSIQYTCSSMEKYGEYRDGHAARLQEEHTVKYKDKFVAFRTLLEIV